MARIGLCDVDGKLMNLALMKLSTYHKACGDSVVLNPDSPIGLDRTYVSLIFTRSRRKALKRYGHYPNVQFGGTGYSLDVTLPPEVEGCRPDYDLYSVNDIFNSIKCRPGKRESAMAKAMQIRDSGIGFTTRGCIRRCAWCVVPAKEGKLKQIATIGDLINPRSRLLTILDNSFTADPLCIPKLEEIRDRKLIVNITQGIDIRLVDQPIAKALSEVRHWGSLHYAWDQTQSEKSVFEGIKTLSSFIKPHNHMCYLLAGFNTSWEEDVYRVTKLLEKDIRPYIMLFRPPEEEARPKNPDFNRLRLEHFKRYINAPKALYKKISFAEYEGWVEAQKKLVGAHGAQQLALAL